MAILSFYLHGAYNLQTKSWKYLSAVLMCRASGPGRTQERHRATCRTFAAMVFAGLTATISMSFKGIKKIALLLHYTVEHYQLFINRKSIICSFIFLQISQNSYEILKVLNFH